MIDVTSKIAQTTQNIWNFIPESLVYKKWQTSAIIGEILDSNLIMETGRYGGKSAVSRIIRESWQPCHGRYCIPKSNSEHLNL